MQPVIVLFKRGEKFIYPTTLECRTPAIFRCTGPAPELLTIIAHYDDTFPVRRCQGTQGMNCFAGRTPGDGVTQRLAGGIDPQHRSEEHTSELQSHSDLVCRLLLEKQT